ncbi:hypothetical protein ACQ4LE_000758 [Meloidogyne hapla]|uniref:Uncharacterized protein n=1 Tax=Meloidogyne hapla TaxID=6305 RepID=A0A1I8BE13_MELHA
MVSEPEYQPYYNKNYNREADEALFMMFIMVVVIFCFCCGIYQVMNYQNEKAEFERIRRLQIIQYHQRRQLERQYQAQQCQQQYAYIQPYVVYPVAAAQIQCQWTVNEQSNQDPPQYSQLPYPPV